MTAVGTIQTAASARASRYPSLAWPARGMGHGPGGWWALLSWTEQDQAFGESHRPLLCAGWVHASHIRPRDGARPADYVDVPRERLPQERRLWPPPSTQPDEAWPDRWYVGVLDGGELPLPPWAAEVRRAMAVAPAA
jgi:hypothetical protein